MNFFGSWGGDGRVREHVVSWSVEKRAHVAEQPSTGSKQAVCKQTNTVRSGASKQGASVYTLHKHLNISSRYNQE